MPESARFLDPRIETMSREQLQTLQENILLERLPYIYSRSALVRERWQQAGVTPDDIRSLADFSRLVPMISKDDIRHYRDEHQDPCGGLLCTSAPHLQAVGFTSGTTGDPTPLPYARPTSAPTITRDFWHMGMRPGDYMALTVFTFREGHAYDAYADLDFRPITFQHAVDQLPRLLEAAQQFPFKVLHTTSAPLIAALDELANTQGIDLAERFKHCESIVFGGEPPSPRVQKLVASWGVEMFQICSLGDVGSMFECKDHSGFHAWEDSAIVECVDPQSGAALADGERGELVVTALRDKVAPLVRYRTDDLISLNREPCACGRTHVRIHVHGRLGDELLVQDVSILPRDVMPIIESVPACRSGLFQIIRPQRQMDCLRIRVGYNPQVLDGDLASLSGTLVSLLMEALAVPVVVELIDQAELLRQGPPHKIPRVTKA